MSNNKETKKFNFAKLNISQDIFNQDFDEIKNKKIPEFIMQFKLPQCSASFKSERGHTWSFKDIKRINDDVIFGNLVVESMAPVYTLEGNHTGKTEESVVNLASFYYYINSEIIAFNAGSNINKKRFITNFENVFNKSNNSTVHLGDVKIILLTKTDPIQSILLNDTITEIKLSYIAPNNPNTDNLMENTLNQARAKSAEFQVRNIDGLNTHDDNDSEEPSSLIKSIVNIIKNGWGSLSARNNQNKTFSSAEYPISQSIDPNNQEEIDRAVKKIEEEKSKK